MIQIGGAYTTFCQEEGILLQKYSDRNGRCIAILFQSIRVRGRFDSPDYSWAALQCPPPAIATLSNGKELMSTCLVPAIILYIH